METKTIWTSRTFWANIVALGASFATAYGLDIGMEQQGAIVGGVMALVNIALRFDTSKKVTLK